MSVQKIAAVLRKAGFQAAKWHRSGQVRGWGSWTSGFKAEACRWSDKHVATVRHYGNSHAADTEQQRELAAARLASYEAALKAAGFSVEHEKNHSGETVGLLVAAAIQTAPPA